MKPENFGNNLKTVLDFLEVTQTALASASGLTQAAISQLVSGEREPSLSSVCKILNALPMVKFERLVK